jgi:hypothetical protein
MWPPYLSLLVTLTSAEKAPKKKHLKSEYGVEGRG